MLDPENLLRRHQLIVKDRPQQKRIACDGKDVQAINAANTVYSQPGLLVTELHADLVPGCRPLR